MYICGQKHTNGEILQHTILFHHLIALLSLTAFVMGNWLSWQTLGLFIAQRLVQKPICKNIQRQDVGDFWWKLASIQKKSCCGRKEINDSLLFLFCSSYLSGWCGETPQDKMEHTFSLQMWKAVQVKGNGKEIHWGVIIGFMLPLGF